MSAHADADREPHMNTKHNLIRPFLFLTATLTASLAPSSALADDGETRIIIVDLEQGVMQEDGLTSEIENGVIEVPVGDLDLITVLFIVPPNAGVFVTEDGVWTETLVPSETSRLLAFDLIEPRVPASVPEEFGFEIALPGQSAPTLPTVVIVPTDEAPEPT
jgi:hypothetical protein